jgi:hypothetical protein
VRGFSLEEQYLAQNFNLEARERFLIWWLILIEDRISNGNFDFSKPSNKYLPLIRWCGQSWSRRKELLRVIIFGLCGVWRIEINHSYCGSDGTSEQFTEWSESLFLCYDSSGSG